MWFFTFVVILGLEPLRLAGTCAACAIHVQAVVVGVKGVETSGIHHRRKIVVFYLLHLAASGTDQVGVGQQVDALILRLHPFEYMAPKHFGIHQQLDGIINCRAAYEKTVTIDHLLQFLYGEVPIDVHDTVQDGIALGGLAHAVGIKVVAGIAYNLIVAVHKILDIWIGSHWCDKGTINFAIKQRFRDKKK